MHRSLIAVFALAVTAGAATITVTSPGASYTDATSGFSFTVAPLDLVTSNPLTGSGTIVDLAVSGVFGSDGYSVQDLKLTLPVSIDIQSIGTVSVTIPFTVTATSTDVHLGGDSFSTTYITDYVANVEYRTDVSTLFNLDATGSAGGQYTITPLFPVVMGTQTLPEPATWSVALLGLLAIYWRRHKAPRG